jgi:hypothetical protein
MWALILTIVTSTGVTMETVPFQFKSEFACEQAALKWRGDIISIENRRRSIVTIQETSTSCIPM